MNTISFTDDEHMIRIMEGILKRMGYLVFPPQSQAQRITQADLQIEFNQSAKNISYALRHPKCPKYIGFTGPKGSITGLEMNPELHAWLTARFNQ